MDAPGSSGGGDGGTQRLYLRVKRRRQLTTAEGQEDGEGTCIVDSGEADDSSALQYRDEGELLREDRHPSRKPRWEVEGASTVPVTDEKPPQQKSSPRAPSRDPAEGNGREVVDGDDVIVVRCQGIASGERSVVFRRLAQHKERRSQRLSALATPSAKIASSTVGTTRKLTQQVAVRQREKLRCERIRQSREGLVIDAQRDGDSSARAKQQRQRGNDDDPEDYIVYVAEMPTYDFTSTGGGVGKIIPTLDSTDEYERHVGLGTIEEYDERFYQELSVIAAQFDLKGLPLAESFEELSALATEHLEEEEEERVFGERFVLAHAQAVADEDARLRLEAERNAAEVCHRWDDEYDSNSSANASRHEYGGIDDDEDIEGGEGGEVFDDDDDDEWGDHDDDSDQGDPYASRRGRGGGGEAQEIGWDDEEAEEEEGEGEDTPWRYCNAAQREVLRQQRGEVVPEFRQYCRDVSPNSSSSSGPGWGMGSSFDDEDYDAMLSRDYRQPKKEELAHEAIIAEEDEEDFAASQYY